MERNNGRLPLGREKNNVRPQTVLDNRQEGTVTGVRDIHSFNESEILLETEAGRLSVKGELLHVRRLNLEKGEADIEGKINSLTYLSKKDRKQRRISAEADVPVKYERLYGV